MARKGNPISVRLDLNRSSDPSRFSEGDPKGGNRSKNRRGTFISVYLIGIRILLCPQRLYFCRLVWGLLLGLLFCVESATAQPTGGEIVMAPSGEPSVNQAPPSEEPSVNQAPPSEEPSVNQAPPEFHPVQLELAQRAQLQQEILLEIMKLYRNYILNSSPWMKFNTEYLTGTDITNVARLIMEQCDLELVSTAELDEFLQDIRANPKQLDDFCKELWGRGRRGR
uniref:Uncharacterized protein n=1 Tax=Cynodon dactylon x Cynodon transvaalensis TaxID=1920021 RepID=A0A5J6YEP2_9POAL|nr:hypothetical protein [Cynodon dactylon x Cynodon transvaalensis]